MDPKTVTKVVFLDIDGVLVTARSKLAAGRPDAMDGDACAMIAALCRAAPARVVVSSTWREESTRETLGARFSACGLPAELLHADWATPILSACRQDEIDRWLAAHPEVQSFAIVDDGLGLDERSPRLIRTDTDNGLQFADAVRICAVLDVDAQALFRAAGIQFTASDRGLIEAVRAALDLESRPE